MLGSEAPSEGGVGIHAGHNPIDVRVGKQKAAASRWSYNLQLVCGERQGFSETSLCYPVSSELSSRRDVGVNENLPFAAAGSFFFFFCQCLGTVVDSVAFSSVLKEQCVSPGWE